MSRRHDQPTTADRPHRASPPAPHLPLLDSSGRVRRTSPRSTDRFRGLILPGRHASSTRVPPLRPDRSLGRVTRLVYCSFLGDTSASLRPLGTRETRNRTLQVGKREHVWVTSSKARSSSSGNCLLLPSTPVRRAVPLQVCARKLPLCHLLQGDHENSGNTSPYSRLTCCPYIFVLTSSGHA